MNRRFVLAAALLAACPALPAQHDQQPSPHAAMPDPKRPEHEALRALVGTWECVMKMDAMPGVPGMEEPMESEGTEHAELICNGLWLKSVVDATCRGEPFQGLWLAGYDPFRKTYVSAWVCSDESQGGGACTMDGRYDAKTKTWTWRGKTPHGDVRSVYAFDGPDRVVETCYMTAPGGGGEVKCMEITRQRVKSSLAAPAGGKPASDLVPEQARLLADVGDWDASVKMTTPGHEPSVDQATERVAAICHGRWLWSDFRGELMGGPFEGHGLVGYDPAQKRYVSFWVDSMSPAWLQASGTYDAAKKAYRFEGTTVCPIGNPMAVREVLTCKDGDTRLLQMEFDSEGQTSHMEIAYRRTAKR